MYACILSHMLGVWAHTFNPSTRREAEAGGSLEFQDSLVYTEFRASSVYTVSSRPANATQWNTVSRTNKQAIKQKTSV